MNEPIDAGPGHEDAPDESRDRSQWWATLEPEALEDETRTNRRRERLLFLWALVGLVAAIPVLLAHPETLLP